MPEYKLVMVFWQDAQGDVGWMQASEVKADGPIIKSVGWLIGNDEEKGVAILSADTSGVESVDSNRRLEIPLGCVLDVKPLKEPKMSEKVKQPKSKVKVVKKPAAKKKKGEKK